MPRMAHLQEMDDAAMDGMARALWVHAYMIWVTEVEPAPEITSDDWGSQAPNTAVTRRVSMQSARALAELIQQVNDLGARPLGALFLRMSARADANRAYMFGREIALLCVGVRDRADSTLIPPGHAFPVLPSFHIELDDDGQELTWEGGVEATENPAWPSSSVQSLLFERGRYTERQAQRWAQDHGYRHTAVDTTGDYIHLRQFPPDGRPCRNIEFGHGVHAVVCATSNPGTGPTVLILEDDPKIQSALSRWVKKIFGARNVHIAVADNVDAAVADLSAHDVKLIVSDVDVIGNQSGLDFFEHVKTQRPDLVDRFIFFTGNSAAQAVHYRYVPKGGATFEDFKRVYRADRAELEGGPAPEGASPVALPRTRATSAPMTLAEFAEAVTQAMRRVPEGQSSDGRFQGRVGDNVFIAAAWRALRDPRLSAMTLEQFKHRLLQANREQLLLLSRADAQGDMDTDDLVTSEIEDMGARFHFIQDLRRNGGMSLREFARLVSVELPYIPVEPDVDGYRARGRFGRKVFISALWRQMKTHPRFDGMTLPQFQQRLVQAHRERLLTLARADLVAAMDPREVAESETDVDGIAQFHFVVDE